MGNVLLTAKALAHRPARFYRETHRSCEGWVKPAEAPVESARRITTELSSDFSTLRFAISPDGQLPLPCPPRNVHVAQLLVPSHSVGDGGLRFGLRLQHLSRRYRWNED